VLFNASAVSQQSATDLSLTEQIAYSTIRIQVNVGNSVGIATGFFFSFLKDSLGNIPVIVTNKHVIAGSQRGTNCERFSQTLPSN